MTSWRSVPCVLRRPMSLLLLRPAAVEPTAALTVEPTAEPPVQPTAAPTARPTAEPAAAPTLPTRPTTGTPSTRRPWMRERLESYRRERYVNAGHGHRRDAAGLVADVKGSYFVRRRLRQLSAFSRSMRYDVFQRFIDGYFQTRYK